MSKRAWMVVAVVRILSLVIVGVVTAAQVGVDRVVPLPRVLSGEDVGFRVEGVSAERPMGTLVVRVNGRWVEASLSSGFMRKPATGK